jgi:hypothetical protein
MSAEHTTKSELLDLFTIVEDRERLPASPMVSVAISTFQHVDYIRTSLDSVLMQRVDFPYEIIIKEDRSTDGTREIVLDYQRNHPDKFRLFLSKENLYSKGIRGKVIGQCIGKYIAKLEGDDYWTDPLKLQKQVDILEADEAAVGCFTNAWNERDGVRSDYISAWLGKETCPEKVFLKDIIGRNFIPTASLVYRTAAQRPLDALASKAPLGDQILHVNLLRSGHYIYLDKYTCVRRVHGGGVISMKPTLEKLETNIRSLEVVGELLGPEHAAVVALRMARHLRRAIPMLVRRGQVDKARGYWARLRASGFPGITWRERIRLFLVIRFPALFKAYMDRASARMKSREITA